MFNLAWDFYIFAVIVFEEVELILMESCINILFLDRVAVDLQRLVEMHNNNVIIALGYHVLRLRIRLEIVNARDLSILDIPLQAHIFRELSKVLEVLLLDLYFL